LIFIHFFISDIIFIYLHASVVERPNYI